MCESSILVRYLISISTIIISRETNPRNTLIGAYLHGKARAYLLLGLTGSVFVPIFVLFAICLFLAETYQKVYL